MYARALYRIRAGAAACLLTACASLPAIPTRPPTPTPTPAPTPTPVLVLTLTEDFNDPASGWDAGSYTPGDVGYDSGQYFVRAAGAGVSMWGAAGLSYADVVIDVKASWLDGPANGNAGYGVACRVQPDGDGYWARISGDGMYSIFAVVDGHFERLIRWRGAEGIRTGRSQNRLRLSCIGPLIALAINGQQYPGVQDERFTGGDIALVATSFEPAPVEARFDDLLVWQP